MDRYTWVDLGSSYLPAEILAAFLLAQLERRGEIQARRRALWERYLHELAGWAERHGVGLPRVPAHCSHPAHLFHLLLPDLATRQRLIDRTSGPAPITARPPRASNRNTLSDSSAMGR